MTKYIHVNQANSLLQDWFWENNNSNKIFGRFNSLPKRSRTNKLQMKNSWTTPETNPVDKVTSWTQNTTHNKRLHGVSIRSGESKR